MRPSNQHRRTAKDLLNRWRSLFKRKTGKNFHVIWSVDLRTIKLLRSSYTDRDMVKLIDFAFSDHPSTKYLRDTGYSLAVFRRTINQYSYCLRKDFKSSDDYYIPEKDVWDDVPFWADSRLEWLWDMIVHSRINELIDGIRDEFLWRLLIYKIKLQTGENNGKVMRMFELWKAGDYVARKAVKFAKHRRPNS